MLQALTSHTITNPKMRQIHHRVHEAWRNNLIVHFLWADEAARRPEEYIPVCYLDWFPVVYAAVRQEWNTRWHNSRSALRVVQPELRPMMWMERLSCREVVINRLKCGHTLFSHGYLIYYTGPRLLPICEYCQDALMSVNHVLLDCPAL